MCPPRHPPLTRVGPAVVLRAAISAVVVLGTAGSFPAARTDAAAPEATPGCAGPDTIFCDDFESGVLVAWGVRSYHRCTVPTLNLPESR